MHMSISTCKHRHWKLPINIEDACEINRPTLGRNIDVVVYRAVILSVVKNLGFNALSKLYHAGVEFGKSLGIKTFEELIEGFTYLGLGIPEIIDSSPLVIRVRECVFCSGLSKVKVKIKQPICHFERGILAGCLETILGKRTVIKETKCCIMGHDFCEFIVETGV